MNDDRSDWEVLPDASPLQQAVPLPCGLTLPNRLVKVGLPGSDVLTAQRLIHGKFVGCNVRITSKFRWRTAQLSALQTVLSMGWWRVGHAHQWCVLNRTKAPLIGLYIHMLSFIF